MQDRLPVRSPRARRPLYTPEERRRRDASRWTLVQGVLAPVQLLAMAVSAALLVRYLATGQGWTAAAASVVVKTALLYTIMVTGSIWEKDVFGKWLFAPAFFWEDVVSMGVIALHTAYLAGLAFPIADHRSLAWLALAAYAAYAVNAAQFLLKLRAARLQERGERARSIESTSIDRSSVDRESVDRESVDRNPVDGISIDGFATVSIDRTSADQTSTDRIPTDRNPTDRPSMDRLLLDRPAMEGAA